MSGIHAIVCEMNNLKKTTLVKSWTELIDCYATVTVMLLTYNLNARMNSILTLP